MLCNVCDVHSGAMIVGNPDQRQHVLEAVNLVAPELAREEAHVSYMALATNTLRVTAQNPISWGRIIVVRVLLDICLLSIIICQETLPL